METNTDSLSLIQVMHIAGLALANTIAALTEMTLLTIIPRKRLGGLDDQCIVHTMLKTLTVSIVKALGEIVFLQSVENAGLLVRAIGGMVIGVGVFSLPC